MNNLHKYISRRYLMILMLAAAAFTVTGCGKDKLTMVTTEKNTNISSSTDSDKTTESIADEIAATATATEEEVVREEVSAEEAEITLEQIHKANRGDVLLAGGKGFSLNTIYYANDVEVYSEYQYIGFDENGRYLQAYEDSDGFVQILDASGSSWYIAENNELSVLIYPEPGVGDAIVDYNHNELLVASPDEAEETIKDIYRANGELTVETSFKTGSAEYIFEYALTDDLKVMAITCFDTEGTKISYGWVTEDASYTIPEAVNALINSENLRNVTITFPNGDGVEDIYSIPAEVPVQVKMVEYSAYADYECAIRWKEMDMPEEGLYDDETIYMDK